MTRPSHASSPRRSLRGLPIVALGGLAWLCVGIAPGSALAQATDEQAADAVGFGSVTMDDAAPNEAPAADDTSDADPGRTDSLSLRGTLGADAALRTTPAGRGRLAKSRGWVSLSLRYQHGIFRAQLGGHAAYDLAYLDGQPAVDRPAYERLLRFEESFLALSGEHAELAVGALVHAMGTADLLGAVDVVTPRDLREPGVLDPAATRLPTLSSRLSFFFGPSRLELGVLHEANYGLRPAPLGEFSPIRDLMLNAPGVAGTELQPLLASRDLRYSDDVRGVSRRAQQFFARVRVEARRLSVELVYARLRDRVGLLRFPNMEALAAPRVALPIAHPFYDQLGVASQVALGDWVLAFEALAEVNKPVAVADPAVPAPLVLAERRDLFTAVVGLRYEGVPGVVLLAEHRRATYAPDARAQPSARGLAPLLPFALSATALRYQHRLAHERVELELALVVFGDRAEGGLLGRAFVSYRPSDAVRLRVGYVLYREGREPGPLRGFGPSDRVLFDLRWDFAAANP